jgi:hypothetical protein
MAHNINVMLDTPTVALTINRSGMGTGAVHREVEAARRMATAAKVVKGASVGLATANLVVDLGGCW